MMTAAVNVSAASKKLRKIAPSEERGDLAEVC